MKTFNSISGNIFLNSQLINDIPLLDYMTKDTDQTIDISHIYGNVYFNKLQLNGLFNYVNITELDDRAIKLSGEQYTEVELVFEKGVILDLDVNELEIRKTLNNIDVNQFISIDEDFELHQDVTLNALVVENCTIYGKIESSIEGDGSVNGWNLRELKNLYLSKNYEQKINVPYFVNTAIVKAGFHAEFVNGFHFPSIIETLKNFKGNDELQQSHVNVDLMIVNGCVTLDNVNGYNFNSIRDNVIWLNRPNKIIGTLEFLDEIVVNGQLNVLTLNKVDFDTFANDLVLRSNENVTIGGTTVFTNTISVAKDINARQLNLYPVESILTKYYSQPIGNPINIYGDVTITNLNLKGSLNGVPSNYIEKTYNFDENIQAHALTANLYFKKPILVDRLQLEGSANNIMNVKSFLANIVRKNQPFNITAPKIFTNSVTFESNLYIVKNGQANMENFFSNIVLIDQANPIEFFSPVTFVDEVNTTIVRINGDLVVPHISQWPVDEWLQNGIRTDLPFTFPGRIRFNEGSLDAPNINAVWLNDHFLEHIVTLFTPQTFPGHVAFGDVTSQDAIDVGETVNGMILKDERENTLMVGFNFYTYLYLPN